MIRSGVGRACATLATVVVVVAMSPTAAQAAPAPLSFDVRTHGLDSTARTPSRSRPATSTMTGFSTWPPPTRGRSTPAAGSRSCSATAREASRPPSIRSWPARTPSRWTSESSTATATSTSWSRTMARETSRCCSAPATARSAPAPPTRSAAARRARHPDGVLPDAVKVGFFNADAHPGHRGGELRLQQRRGPAGPGRRHLRGRRRASPPAPDRMRWRPPTSTATGTSTWWRRTPPRRAPPFCSVTATAPCRRCATPVFTHGRGSGSPRWRRGTSTGTATPIWSSRRRHLHRRTASA